LLIGGGLFFYMLFHGIMHVTDSLTQVVAPGKAELDLQPGRYSVFLEEQSTLNGKIYSTSNQLAGWHVAPAPFRMAQQWRSRSQR
jgi:hypothetical protein